MTALRAWFDARSRREQRLLLVMAALAVLTLAWAAVIRPLGDALASERERHADAVVRLGETQAQVDAVRAAERDRPPPVTGTIADAVRARAEEAGSHWRAWTNPRPDASVSASSLRARRHSVPWLARLERAGILVESAAFTDNGDRTVGVTVTLRART